MIKLMGGCSVAVGALLALLLWPGDFVTANGRAGALSQPVEVAVQPGTATRLGQEMIRRVRERRFVGTIDFEFESTSPVEGVPSFWHTGRMYVGSRGETRLDLWLNNGIEDPVICCVAGNSAWMIWTTSPLVYESSYPIAGNHSGWLGQLRCQAGQTLRWVDSLLTHHLSSTAGKPLRSASVSQNKLSVELGRPESADSPADVRIQATLVADAGDYYPVLVSFADTSTTLTIADHQVVGGQVFPGRVHRLALDGHGRLIEASWTVTCIEPREGDAEFSRFFEPPRAPGPRYPHVIGTCFYGAQGQEATAVWR